MHARNQLVRNPESDGAGLGRSSATRRWVGQQDFRSPSTRAAFRGDCDSY